MSHSPQAEKPLAFWRRVRFSLGGLLVFIFGLAVGLAYARIEGTDWSERLLAVFAGWFIAGMAQTSWHSCLRWRTAPTGVPRDVRFALALDITWPLAAIGMIVLAGSVDVLRRNNTWTESVNDFASWWTLTGLIQALFFLAIICGYTPPAKRSWFGEHRWSRWNALFALLAAGLTLYWLSLVVESELNIAFLVHMAIRGTQMVQPTRWHGREFVPSYLFPELQHQFIHRGLLAGTLSACAFASIVGVAASWKQFWAIRLGLLLIWMACLAWMVVLIHWCHAVALPTLSPFLAPQILTHPALNYWLGFALILFASGVFAWRTSAQPQPDIHNSAHSLAACRFRSFHHRASVMICFLVAAWWGSLAEWGGLDIRDVFFNPQESWSLATWTGDLLNMIEMHVSMPPWMMRLAAVILVAQQLWRMWRTKDQLPPSNYAIDPYQFTIIAVLMAITAVVLVPAIAWYSFALYVGSGLP